jgi:hypothetical protein
MMCTPVIPTLLSLRQDDQKFRAAFAIVRPYLKKIKLSIKFTFFLEIF